LSELLQTHRHARRTITYHDGEQEQRSVSFGELYERALGILITCSAWAPVQAIGCCCSSRTTSLIDAFWAAILGGIVRAVAPHHDEASPQAAGVSPASSAILPVHGQSPPRAAAPFR